MAAPAMMPVGGVERAREVESALASVRIEGLEPSAEAKALFERYVQGELSSDELDREFASFLHRKYGRVPLSRDARP